MASRILVLVFGLSAWPAWSAAQPAIVDPRWSPYLGCWRLERESSRDAMADLLAAARREMRSDERRDDVMMCVTPAAEPTAVSQQTVLNGDTVLDEVVSADGRPQISTEASCTSTRRTEWSQSGRLLFSHGTVSCQGQPDRRIAGLGLVLAGPTWLDVQVAEVSGRRSVRVRRYGWSREQRRAQATRPPGPRALFDRWTLEEVKDAARHTEPEVLQAALVEVGTRLPLNARRLIELDEAGVPGPVVDVLVALSFPEKFVIERASSGSPNTSGSGYTAPMVPLFDPWLAASQYGWLSIYSPFGYQYYGYYDPRFGPGWGWVSAAPQAGTTANDPNGRVVNGEGYTRVRPRDAEPRTTGRVVERPGSGGSWSGGAGGGSNGGGSGVTTGGYSGGGVSGGSDNGRTAVPRPPGNR